MKCQCESTGFLRESLIPLYHPKKELPFVVHLPFECKCKNKLKQFVRNGKKVWLCSNCVLITDIKV